MSPRNHVLNVSAGNAGSSVIGTVSRTSSIGQSSTSSATSEIIRSEHKAINPDWKEERDSFSGLKERKKSFLFCSFAIKNRSDYTFKKEKELVRLLPTAIAGKLTCFSITGVYCPCILNLQVSELNLWRLLHCSSTLLNCQPTTPKVGSFISLFLV